MDGRATSPRKSVDRGLVGQKPTARSSDQESVRGIQSARDHLINFGMGAVSVNPLPLHVGVGEADRAGRGAERAHVEHKLVVCVVTADDSVDPGCRV